MATLVVLAVLALMVRLLESSMAFYPTQGVQETPALAGLAFQDLRIPTADGETLHAWWLEHPQPRAQVVFFHGNGGNLSMWLDLFVGMRRRGLSVLAVDYRGYGASSGAPSEHGLYRDAEAVVSTFAERLRKGSAPVVYWGRSIGSPVAAHAAAQRRPDGLVLDTPMPDARSVLKSAPVMWILSFFSSYRFPTASLVERLDVPLLIVHGDGDTLVPHAAGRRVFEAARTQRKTFVTIPGAGHNDLDAVNPALYWQAIDAFVASLRPEQP